MATNILEQQTKEGFSIWAKAEDGEIYNYVHRDERVTWLEQNEIMVTVEQLLVQDGLAIVQVSLGVKSDFCHGVASTKIADPSTEDHIGLAYKKAIDNALRSLGVGLTLEDGKSISSLNRKLTAEDALKVAMNSQLP